MQYDTLTDGQLLLRAAQGDEAAFTALYTRYGGRLFAYGYSHNGGNAPLAEDLRQQVFLQLLESKVFAEARQGKVRADLSSLLFTIATNLLRTNFRNQQRRTHKEAQFSIQQPALVDTETEIDAQRLQRAMEQISAPQRECLQLRFQSGLTTDEIATALNLAPGTVKSRLHYGLKKMAELLRPMTVK